MYIIIIIHKLCICSFTLQCQCNRKKMDQSSQSDSEPPVTLHGGELVLSGGELYFALGSATLKPTRKVNFENWRERVYNPRPDLLLWPYHPLAIALKKFAPCVWLRMIPNADPDLVTLQVYVEREKLEICSQSQAATRHSDQAVNPSFLAFLACLDGGSAAFRGEVPVATSTMRESAYVLAQQHHESLHAVFNSLPSPTPNAELVAKTAGVEAGCLGIGHLAADAMSQLLEDDLLSEGLITTPFRYQLNATAMMIQREVAPAKALDPRLQRLTGPEGHEFFVERVSGEFRGSAHEYAEARGGVLAEEMGSGKTLVCLLLVLLTKGHMATTPQHLNLATPSEKGTRSLTLTAAGVASRRDVPWKAHIRLHEKEKKEVLIGCEKVFTQHFSSYDLVEGDSRINSRSAAHTGPKQRRIHLSSLTLVVVPQNLLRQWEKEVLKHFAPDAIKFLAASHRPLPPAEELQRYDLLILERRFFENEMLLKEGYDARRAKTGHTSPLRFMRFLRVILDEGHDFVATGRSMRLLSALKVLEVDRRWIVTGTPSSGLVGKELVAMDQSSSPTASSPMPIPAETADADMPDAPAVATAAYDGDTAHDNEDHISISSDESATELANPLVTDVLSQQEREDIRAIGRVAGEVLLVKPWSNNKVTGDNAAWAKYVMPRGDGSTRPANFRAILQSLIVRHADEDRQREVTLPPMTMKYVYIEPCFFDKLSINLFTATFANNAVTSEREGKDYLFHPSSQGSLNQLFVNYRQSSFFWNGFSPKSVRESLKTAFKYGLGKWQDFDAETTTLLHKAIDAYDLARTSIGYKAFNTNQAMGLVVRDFPACARAAWTMCAHDEPAFVQSPIPRPAFTWVSASRLVRAQSFLNADARAFSAAPFSELTTYGLHPHSNPDGKPTKQKKRRKATEEQPDRSVFADCFTTLEKNAGRSSSIKIAKSTAQKFGLPYRGKSRRPSDDSTEGESSKTGEASKTTTANKTLAHGASATETGESSKTKPVKSVLKRAEPEPPTTVPPAYDELARPHLLGTPSAKLSYLLTRIAELQAHEKILVFYDTDAVAFYLAEGLSLLRIEHEIYAARSSREVHERYLAKFEDHPALRVLIMDLKQASHGLNVTAASRVFFVAPVWSQAVESQAVKRAHRIGQTRPVSVEVLVLKGSMEAAMLARRNRMSREEQVRTNKGPLEDAEMRRLLERMPFALVNGAEAADPERQYAPLGRPVQIFATGFAVPEGDDGGNGDNGDDGGDDGGDEGWNGKGKGKAVVRNAVVDGANGGPPKKRARFADEEE